MEQRDKKFVWNVLKRAAELTNPDDSYNTIASDYDKVATLTGASLVAKKLVEFLCQCVGGNEEFDGYSVLDMACGTGIVGENLSKKGFKNIHGIDSSQGMIDVCSKKNIYTKFYNVALTIEATPNITDSAYDLVTACCCYEGTYGIPFETIREVLRLVRPGGFFVFSLQYLDYSVDYMGIIGKLMKENLVELDCMKCVKYCRRPDKDFEFANAYLVALKKL